MLPKDSVRVNRSERWWNVVNCPKERLPRYLRTSLSHLHLHVLQILDINVKVGCLLAKEVVPHMKVRG